MVKLKESKLKWALEQNNKLNKDLALYCNIGVRRFQQLKSHYRKTGEIPKLKMERRPKQFLSKEEIELINKTLRESNLRGALSIRLHIQKYYGKTLPKGKIHEYLLKLNISKKDSKKQKQRKYCRYERKHSFSLGHMDYHESKVCKGKQLIVWIDDASRMILAGMECDSATTENAISVVKQAKKFAWDNYRGVLYQLNTDRGVQFYANDYNDEGEKGISEFEKFLKKEDIKHILSRKNHPQTNGKNERWHRTYEEKRDKFETFEEFIDWYNNRIHLGLSRTVGITPKEAISHKLRQESMIGLLFGGLI